MSRNPSPVWISLVFLGFASAIPAGAGVLESIFLSNFDVAALGGWTTVVGSSCPVISLSPLEVEAELASASVGDRTALFHASEGGPIHGEYVQLFAIEIYEFYGGPVGPDTVNLGTGAQVNYATCGACVLLYRDLDPGPDTEAQYFFQRSGELDLTAYSPTSGGAFEGSVTALLEEVTIDPGTFESTPVPNGCLTGVLDYAFDEVLVGP